MSMTGYTVHTGATAKFVEGWDHIFKKRAAEKGASKAKPAKTKKKKPAARARPAKSARRKTRK